jgi:tRNA uridine 5-carboxymethylaminomethyl modification enzyme
VTEQVEIELKYAGYIGRQNDEIEKTKGIDSKQIPEWLDYKSLNGVRTEARIKLDKLRPRTVGQASRISGVSPSDIGVILVRLKQGPNPDFS